MTRIHFDALADRLYSLLCDSLRHDGIDFCTDDSDRRVGFPLECDGRRLSYSIHVNPSLLLLDVMVLLPFSIRKERRIDIARAVAYINTKLPDGCFDLDVANGLVIFRVAAACVGERFDSRLVRRLVAFSHELCLFYSDPLIAIDAGILKLERFMSEDRRIANQSKEF